MKVEINILLTHTSKFDKSLTITEAYNVKSWVNNQIINVTNASSIDETAVGFANKSSFHRPDFLEREV
jgi:hypothetical protein